MNVKCIFLLLVTVACLTLGAGRAMAESSSSQIDNGFTGGKLFALPATSTQSAIRDQVVIDSGYGGTGPRWPDVFALTTTTDGKAAIIDVYKIDPAAMDFGRIATSPPIKLPGTPIAMASAIAPGFEARHRFGRTYPPVWIGYTRVQHNGVAVVNSRNFAVISHYDTGNATVKALVAINTPLNDGNAPDLDAAFPDVFVAVDHAGSNEVRIFSSRTGALLRTYDAPPGNITAMAATTMNDKSEAVGVAASYPWILIATETDGASTLTLINSQNGDRNGGPLIAPPGVVTGISMVDTALGELNPNRPDIFVSYVTPAGENHIAVYNALSNALVTTYPARSPRGALTGFNVYVTDMDLGIGGEGHGTIFYALRHGAAADEGE